MRKVSLIIFVLTLATPAIGQSGSLIIDQNWTPSASMCPSDHPNRRSVNTGFMNCTLLACIGKLSCPPNGGDCFRLPAGDCNTCTEQKEEVCLSDQELKDAEGITK